MNSTHGHCDGNDHGRRSDAASMPANAVLIAVIGIATSALSRSYGIVVPAATVNRVVDQLLAQGHVGRGFLGVGAQPATGSDGQSGLLVTALMPEGAAARAGLMVGDLIVRIGGFSAYFTQLSPDIQDDVINRIEHKL